MTPIALQQLEDLTGLVFPAETSAVPGAALQPPVLPDSAEVSNRWYDLIAKQAPQLDASARIALEDYCSGDPWSANPAREVMSCIMAEDNAFEDELKDKLGTSYTCVCTALLLMWSLTQNKNKSHIHAANAKDTISRWHEEKMLYNEGTPDSENIRALLAFALPVARHLDLDTRHNFFSAVYGKVMPFLPMHARNSLDEKGMHNRAQLYVDMGHCALAGVGLELPSAIWHEKEWLKDIRELCVGDACNRQAVALAVAQSTLPAAYKLLAFKRLDSDLWSVPAVKAELLPHMPEEDYRKIPMLAFRDTWFTQSGTALLAEVVATNQAIVREYCPKTFELLQLGSTPQDWCAHKKICELAESFYLANGRATEVYALPEEPYLG